MGVLIGVALTTVVVWVVNHFLPGVFGALIKRLPVRVHVEVDPANMYAGAPNWVGSSWVLPSALDPEMLGDPPTSVCRDWRPWMWPKGAFDGDYTEIRVTLQGLGESTVLVDGLLVTPIERVQPVGNCFACPVGGADITPRSVVVDLDSDPGVVTYADRDGGTDRFTFTLSRGEVEVFHIRARANSFRCRWTATLLLIVDGRRQTIHVDDDGEPFRTSATKGLPRWAWYGDRWQREAG
ncbi:MAG: hypothetical protein LC808_02215 [Actinobacteria bacterium]|nr:hypothetical protein [Actinomycetota bacterium]